MNAGYLNEISWQFFFFFSKTGRQQWEITSRSCLGVNGITDLEILGGYHNSIVTIKVC
jgi:hypothetical protein